MGTTIATDNKAWYNFLDKKKIQIGPMKLIYGAGFFWT